jgi:hypothetical protein
MTPAPLQVLVVNFEDANFTGEIADELERLEEAGVIRVLDLAFVAKSKDGEINAGMTHKVHTGAMVRMLLGIDGPAEGRANANDLDLWDAADAIEPGCAAVVVVLEHTWAGPLRIAVQRSGGRHASSEWVDAEYLSSLGVSVGP